MPLSFGPELCSMLDGKDLFLYEMFWCNYVSDTISQMFLSHQWTSQPNHHSTSELLSLAKLCKLVIRLHWWRHWPLLCFQFWKCWLFLGHSGCLGAIVVAEARSAEEPVLSRRCVVMKVSDFTTEKYLEAQKQNAAAILVLVPRNMSSVPQDTMQVTCIY